MGATVTTDAVRPSKRVHWMSRKTQSVWDKVTQRAVRRDAKIEHRRRHTVSLCNYAERWYDQWAPVSDQWSLA